MTNVRHSSASNEHYTPGEIVWRVRHTLGAIDLDPASCAQANTIVRAKRYFDEQQNGYGLPWNGRIFLNPPGGMCDADGFTLTKRPRQTGWFDPDGVKRKPFSAQRLWWFALAHEYQIGRVAAAVFVCFSIELLQTTQRDQPKGLPIPLDFPICFPSRRVDYIQGDTMQPGGGPPHSSAIVFLPARNAPEPWCEQTARFRDAFEQIGKCINLR